MKNKDKKRDRTSHKAVELRLENDDSIETDPLGMYTGVPSDPYEKPVQDADDL